MKKCLLLQNKKLLALIFSIPLLNFANSIFAQEALKSTEEEYYDFLSLQGIVNRPTLGYRTLSDSVWTISDENSCAKENIWAANNLGKIYTLWENKTPADNWFANGISQSVKYKIYGPEWFNSYNTAAPYGQNDGALWQGRGYNSSLTAGIRAEGYGLELTFKPQISFSQNKDFDFLPGIYGSEYSYFWNGNIDLVQRYGNTSFWTFDWGDSEIRYSWNSLTIGFGTQSPWIGPAFITPIIGSNNAPTYPKLDAGIRKTDIYIPYLNFYLGSIEGRFWTGYLSESEYFDKNESINHNVLYAFNFSFSPFFFKNLTIGATKVCLTKWNNRKIEYLNPFYNDNDSNGIDEDQKCSIFTDFLFPDEGFSAFVEIGTDDYCWDKISNPFHTLIYTAGLKKSIPLFMDLSSEVILEIANNEISQDFQLQFNYMGYYAHSHISQGYTQKGQIIGNGYSYFGNSQYIGYRVFHKKGNVLLYFHRFCPDNNYILNKAVHDDAINLIDTYWSVFKTYLSFGLNTTYFIVPNFALTGEFNYNYIHYDMYNKNSDINNFRFILSGKYNF